MGAHTQFTHTGICVDTAHTNTRGYAYIIREAGRQACTHMEWCAHNQAATLAHHGSNHSHTHMPTYTHIYTHIHTCTYTYRHMRPAHGAGKHRQHILAHIQAGIHPYTHTHIHAIRYTGTRAYTHTHTYNGIRAGLHNGIAMHSYTHWGGNAYNTYRDRANTTGGADTMINAHAY